MDAISAGLAKSGISMKQQAISWILGWALLLMVSLIVRADDQPTLQSNAAAAAARQHLIRQWSLLIQLPTAEVEFTRGSIQLSPPTVGYDEYWKLIEEFDLPDRDDRQDEFVTAILRGAKPRGTPWEERKLFMKQRMVRDEGVFTIVARPDHSIFKRPDAQVFVYAPGKSRYFYNTLNSFYHLPMDPLTVAREWPLTVDEQANEIRLHPPQSAGSDLGECEDIVDLTTGLVRRWKTVRDGRVISETSCLNVVDLPGNIPFPMFSLVADFSDGKLASLATYRVHHVKMNEDIPDERFVMNATAGTVLFDERYGDDRVAKPEVDVPDVVAYLDGGAALVPRAQTANGASGQSLERVLLLVNGLLLVIAGALLWRRRAPSSSNP
ncbi:MAG: hypothetical protein KDA58_05675 [Planctomycetaceae bacterium]|nr:hypothetical protein [Planctomycetaceae bacterium]